MPRPQAPLNSAKARSWASNTISWVSARIDPHEQHAAVTEPNVSGLHGHRHAVEQDDLVAPVELIGFTRCEGQRDVGRRSRLTAFLAPPSGVAPHRIVATLVTAPAQF